jgi:pimeloyl-ACP methyl ester carboxylesterase
MNDYVPSIKPCDQEYPASSSNRRHPFIARAAAAARGPAGAGVARNGWQETAIETPDGCRITATIREGTGPALVLIPETWGNADTRGPMLERLDTNLKLICVSLAGQDDNWPPPDQPSIPRFSAHVMALADQIGLGRFFVAGHSLGGMVSLDLLRYGPARILGAISIEGWTHWTVKSRAFADNTDSTLTDAQRRFLDDVRHRLLDRWDPALRARYCAVWREWDGWDILNATPIPVLEIWGDRGRSRPSLACMRIPARPNIDLAWMPDASHNLLVEAPDRLAGLLNYFIEKHAIPIVTGSLQGGGSGCRQEGRPSRGRPAAKHRSCV